MSAWQDSIDVCRDGLAVLVPYAHLRFPGLELIPMEGQFFLDAVYGDWLLKHAGKHAFVEVKTERRDPNGNFFIEHWSNERWRNPGWFYKCRADVLWYYFLESDELYRINFRALRMWGLTNLGSEAWMQVNLDKYPERDARADQRNATMGRLVPIQTIVDLGFVNGDPPEHPRAACEETGTPIVTQKELLY